jgi:hypothetical protein
VPPQRARAADRRWDAARIRELIKPESKFPQHLQIFEPIGAAAREAVGPELGHQDAVGARREQAARAANYLGLGALHVDLDELDR